MLPTHPTTPKNFPGLVAFKCELVFSSVPFITVLYWMIDLCYSARVLLRNCCNRDAKAIENLRNEW
jgi:hypothetical protein